MMTSPCSSSKIEQPWVPFCGKSSSNAPTWQEHLQGSYAKVNASPAPRAKEITEAKSRDTQGHCEKTLSPLATLSASRSSYTYYGICGFQELVSMLSHCVEVSQRPGYVLPLCPAPPVE